MDTRHPSLEDKQFNVVLQKEYLIIKPADPRPILATQSVRGCYAVLIHHPQRSAIVHWDDNTCHLDFEKFIQTYQGEDITLAECRVSLIGGWKDHEQSSQCGDFIKRYFETRSAHLSLEHFKEKSQRGSLREQGFHTVTLDSRSGEVTCSDVCNILISNDEKFHGPHFLMRDRNRDLTDITYMQTHEYPSSGTHVYARDDFENILENEWNAISLAAKNGDTARLIELLDQATTHINLVPAKAKGYTALHYACHAKQYEAAHILLAHGANLYQENGKGQTPLDLLKENGFQKERLKMAYKVIKANFDQERTSIATISLFARHPERINKTTREELAQIHTLLSTEEGVALLQRHYP